MNQLMETLFDLLESSQASEMELRAVRKSEEIVQAVQERLTREEFEKFWDSAMEIGCTGQLDSFTMGFRLGVQLILEGLRPIVE